MSEMDDRRLADPLFQLSTYDYLLKKELIAQFPLTHRDQARLMVLRQTNGSPKKEHRFFQDVTQYLQAGDLLVLNDTRVIPARLFTRKVPTQGLVEVLLLRVDSSENPCRWEALIKGSMRIGQRLQAGQELELTVLERFSDGRWLVEIICEGEPYAALDRVGVPPLPPYIRRVPQESDREQYQTVYAKPSSLFKESGGSVAAPTAGLHFTKTLLEKIQAQGVRLAYITLHIGPGTFRPIRASDIRLHRMDPEYYEIPSKTARWIEETRAGRGRIICVGTSTTRALETAMTGRERLSGMTDLFIYPGYKFEIVSGLITNFHLPQSTPFLLVAAFTGIKALGEAYAEAIRMHYRFLSFGDAMLIL